LTYNYGLSGSNYSEPKVKSFKNDEELLEEKIAEAASGYLLNQCVLINGSNDIVYIKGETPFLTHSQGRATTNIFKSLKEELTLDVRSVLNDVQKEKIYKVTQFRSVTLYGDVLKYVRVIIIPVENEKNEDWFYALFFQSENIENLKGYVSQSSDENETIANLTTELSRTKAHLQNVIEELETSYEEMQSLNEELSSSNEELQSSNEELETTNEELQSTNEELQTAYSELKVMYDDKDMRTKQLEELAEKLRFQTDGLRKQKELTEAIINTTPVAIIMTDTSGKISFSNINAQNLFKHSKKNLLERYFDVQSWQIKDIHGEQIAKEDMPINIIKKSFESLRNYHVSLENGEHYRILVSLNGSPLFDAKGDFIGIVFSLEDITQKQIMQDQLKYYEDKQTIDIGQTIEASLKKIKTTSLENSYKAQFNLLQLGMLDMSVGLKNSLAEATLLASSLEKTAKSELSEELSHNLNNVLLSMTTLINGNVSYYNDLYLNHTIDFVRQLKKGLELFAYSFESNGINVKNSITSQTIISGSPKELVMFLFRLFELILSLGIKNCEIDYKDESLLIKVDKEYNEDVVREFLEYCDEFSLKEIFNSKIQRVIVE